MTVRWAGNIEPSLAGVYEFREIATKDGRYVVIARSWDGLARMWTSGDGLGWTQASFPYALTEDVELMSVAASADEFVAVGSKRRYVGADGGYLEGGVAFVSADGLTWDVVESDAVRETSLQAVVAVDGNFLAFGWEGVFTSPDGRTWAVSTDPTAVAVALDLEAVVSDGSSLWAFSRTAPLDERNATIEVWTTGDGATWSLVGNLPGSRGGTLTAAAAGPGMIIAINEATTWFSVDGAEWRQAAQPPRNIEAAFVDPTGLIAVGYYVEGNGCAYSEDQEVGVTWTSVDGNFWRKMSERGFKGRVVQALTRSGRTLIGLGVDYNLWDDNDAMVWTSQLPDLAEDQHPPSPPPTPQPGEGC